ncbi:hypothetical protein [Roseomonas rosulenta]|uniref:hypothetical protein n=1 Tax=Roseomonas rosulenta TaxID=2748667 RepID=UPI0038CFF464
MPHPTHSALHRWLKRHGVSRSPRPMAPSPPASASSACPIGYFHIDIAEVRTEQGKLQLLVAIGSPGREKSSATPRWYVQRSSSRHTNALPWSTRIACGQPRRAAEARGIPT